jgi:hypothetical protein
VVIWFTKMPEVGQKSFMAQIFSVSAKATAASS